MEVLNSQVNDQGRSDYEEGNTKQKHVHIYRNLLFFISFIHLLSLCMLFVSLFWIWNGERGLGLGILLGRKGELR